MSNKPFDRQVINNLERPLSSDINLGQSYWSQAVGELFRRSISGSQLSGPTAAGTSQGQDLPQVGFASFLGSGFRPRSVGAMQVSLEPGLGFFNDNTQTQNVGNVSGVNDQEVLKPLVLTAAETINVPAADPANPRIDLIEVKIGRSLIDPSSRDVFNPSAAAFQPNSVNKTLTYGLNGLSTINGAGAINYKTGTPAASPSAPAVDSGYAAIGYVRVPANAAVLGATSMIDSRKLALPFGQLKCSANVMNGITGNNALPAILAEAAPPGVEMGIITSTNPGSIYAMIVIAGDSSFNAYRSIALPSSFTATAVGGTGTTFGALIQSFQTGYLLTAADVAKLATGLPPVLAAVGQPAVRVDYQSTSSVSSGGATQFPTIWDFTLGY